MVKMKMKAKITALALGATVCCGVGMVSMTTTNASAESTANFYMMPGAAVNLQEDYGGIRWGTVVEKGYMPAEGVTVKSFGTFVIPTTTYQANKGTIEISEMEGASDISATVSASDVAANEVTYYSAIMYDDILEDYKEAKGIETLTAEEETELLKKAYTMELTAISYALGDNDVYYYATAEETSRSARQVANIALLVEDESEISVDKEEQLESYIQTGAVNPTKVVSTTESYANSGNCDIKNIEKITKIKVFESSVSHGDIILDGNKMGLDKKEAPYFCIQDEDATPVAYFEDGAVAVACKEVNGVKNIYVASHTINAEILRKIYAIANVFVYSKEKKVYVYPNSSVIGVYNATENDAEIYVKEDGEYVDFIEKAKYKSSNGVLRIPKKDINAFLFKKI